MSDEPSPEVVRAVMSAMGRKTSAAKKESGRKNAAKATAASQTPEARENRRRAQVERWERVRAARAAVSVEDGATTEKV